MPRPLIGSGTGTVAGIMSDWPRQGWREGLAEFGRQLARQAGDAVHSWRDRASALAGRWSQMRGGEKANIVLYVLTAVSMLALTTEFLAGPDNLPTEVTSAPAAKGSSGLTPVVPVSTTALTLPPTSDAVPPQSNAAPPPTTRPAAANPAAAPVTPAPTAAPPEPPPTVPPETTPPTEPPTTNPPATVPTTGFTVVPPVLPSFP